MFRLVCFSSCNHVEVHPTRCCTPSRFCSRFSEPAALPMIHVSTLLYVSQGCHGLDTRFLLPFQNNSTAFTKVIRLSSRFTRLTPAAQAWCEPYLGTVSGLIPSQWATHCRFFLGMLYPIVSQELQAQPPDIYFPSTASPSPWCHAWARSHRAASEHFDGLVRSVQHLPTTSSRLLTNTYLFILCTQEDSPIGFFLHPSVALLRYAHKLR